MTWHERVGNIHIHSTFSDGSGSHWEIAAAAQAAGLDFCLVTDHNMFEPQYQGWHEGLLLIVGEEVHDPDDPDANHLLVFGARQKMSAQTVDAQEIIDATSLAGGLTFFAHPFERSGRYISEPEINWTRWDVDGYTGIELWNYMSEFKSHIDDVITALVFAFAPRLAITGPFQETLSKWDELLLSRPVPAIGSSDAHALLYRLGPLARRVFSYQHLFRAINTHILVSEPWCGDPAADAALVYGALADGRAFIGNDDLAPTRGFKFSAQCRGHTYHMGDAIESGHPVSFSVHLPSTAQIRLIMNGFCVAESRGDTLTFEGGAPGAYRVEAYRNYAFRQRGWIFSNPIYVTE